MPAVWDRHARSTATSSAPTPHTHPPPPPTRRRLNGADFCADASRSTILHRSSDCDPPTISPISPSRRRFALTKPHPPRALKPGPSWPRADRRNLRRKPQSAQSRSRLRSRPTWLAPHRKPTLLSPRRCGATPTARRAPGRVRHRLPHLPNPSAGDGQPDHADLTNPGPASPRGDPSSSSGCTGGWSARPRDRGCPRPASDPRPARATAASRACAAAHAHSP